MSETAYTVRDWGHALEPDPIYARVRHYVQRRRGWRERLFARLDGRWQPRVRWVTEYGPYTAMKAMDGGFAFELSEPAD